MMVGASLTNVRSEGWRPTMLIHLQKKLSCALRLDCGLNRGATVSLRILIHRNLVFYVEWYKQWILSAPVGQGTVMKNLTQFVIHGLFTTKNIEINIDGNVVIIVGPNGIGKSTVASIFYNFVSMQWDRLLLFPFDSLSITIGDQIISATRDDLASLAHVSTVAERLSLPSGYQQALSKIVQAGLINEFLSDKRISKKNVEFFAALTGSTPVTIETLHRRAAHQFSAIGEDLFTVGASRLKTLLTEHITARVIYLPTYRRIEKDIQEIFPHFEERFRRAIGEHLAMKSGRSNSHYVELVSFGMDDVRESIAEKVQQLKSYSLSQHNALSAAYLRDVIRGNADKFDEQLITSLTEPAIDNILQRVSETTLVQRDKDLLKQKIGKIKGKKSIDVADKYLAHYFSQLVQINEEIKSKEEDVRSFVNVCNKYLTPGKTIAYEDANFNISVVDDEGRLLELRHLSSGEKQVVSLFAHLYLDDQDQQIIIIDEPELSLSVPWQKEFLPDIVAAPRCEFLLAVTHSPFVFQNHLESKSVDLRRTMH
jgi:ABC-type Mn2+/Zn2+ transport system ATPase subunit